jgi:hypothetical protein
MLIESAEGGLDLGLSKFNCRVVLGLIGVEGLDEEGAVSVSVLAVIGCTNDLDEYDD